MNALGAWLGSDPGTLRIWLALAPAVALLVLLTPAFVAYVARRHHQGPFRDSATESRGSTAVLGMPLRLFFTWLVGPLVRLLVRARVSADTVTLASVVLAAGAALGVATGHFALGGWIYLATGLCDFLDGRVARATDTAGLRGGVLDSVVDRYTEGLLLVGLAWFYRDNWVLIPVLLALTGSFLVPYVRARGEAAGVAFRNVGLMQRPERIVLLGTTIALSSVSEVLLEGGPSPHHWLAIAGITVLAASSHITAVQRLRFLLRSLPSPRRAAHRHGATHPSPRAPSHTSVDRVGPAPRATHDDGIGVLHARPRGPSRTT